MTTIEQFSKEQMILELTKKYGDKTISFGCKIDKQGFGHYVAIENKDLSISDKVTCLKPGFFYSIDKVSVSQNEIIGHELLLTDILKALDDKYGIWSKTTSNISYAEDIIRQCNLESPYLKDQSIETITAVYNLLFNK